MANMLTFAGEGRFSKDKKIKKFEFKEILINTSSLSKYCIFKKAFSVAEAMITILIVSIMLTLMAPLMSKKNSSSSSAGTEIPSGAIMAFDRDSCPAGWTPLTNTHGDAWGAFIRNVGGGAKVRGAIQYDAAPNIAGWIGMDNAITTVDNGLFQWRQASWNLEHFRQGGYSNGMLDFNAQRVHPSYGRDSSNEVRPKNIAFLYCRKN